MTDRYMKAIMDEKGQINWLFVLTNSNLKHEEMRATMSELAD